MDKLTMVKAIHDASVALGAQCGDDCWFGGAQDQPMAYDSYKSHTSDRALMFLRELGRAI